MDMHQALCGPGSERMGASCDITSHTTYAPIFPLQPPRIRFNFEAVLVALYFVMNTELNPKPFKVHVSDEEIERTKVLLQMRRLPNNPAFKGATLDAGTEYKSQFLAF